MDMEDTQNLFGRLTLNKVIVLTLAAGYIGLLVELRFYHEDVLGKQALSWTPLIYSGLMLVLIGIGLKFWNGWGRSMLMWAFSLGFIVGVLGVWLHTSGKPISALTDEAAAWTRPLHRVGQHGAGDPAPDEGPPTTAPMAFAGLALLGVLATTRKFEGESTA